MSGPIFGVIGWKNSGKTTLVARLVEEFTERGLKVSAIKHAHHSFDIDYPERDTYKLREAGASQVAIVSPKRWALMHELRGDPEPAFEHIVSHIGLCDLILVEGFKNGPFPKIEARSTRSLTKDALANKDENIVAIASDHEIGSSSLPRFSLDDVMGIADFISDFLSLEPGR